MKISALLLAVVMLVGLWAIPSALADEKPRYGGMLRVAIAGDPPSLDMHQEQTFLVTIPFSQSTTRWWCLTNGYPNIIGRSREVVDNIRRQDGLTSRCIRESRSTMAVP